MVNQSTQTANYLGTIYLCSQLYYFAICLTSYLTVEALKAMTVKISASWDMMQCSVVEVYKHFGGTCYHFWVEKSYVYRYFGKPSTSTFWTEDFLRQHILEGSNAHIHTTDTQTAFTSLTFPTINIPHNLFSSGYRKLHAARSATEVANYCRSQERPLGWA
jgi:hypothetical protein